MEIILSDCETQEPFYRSPYAEDFAASGFEESEKKLLRETYTIHLEEKRLDGIHVILMDMNTRQEGEMWLKYTEGQAQFLFCMEGSIQACAAVGKENSFVLQANQQRISLSQPNSILLKFSKKTSLVWIQMAQDLYYKNMGSEFSRDLPVYAETETALEIQMILQGLKNDQCHKRVKRIFLQVKIFEMIVFLILRAEKETIVSMKKEDVEKILLAKSLVENNIQMPHSLMELSRRAGINDYKLKKGFKELTGETVFGYLYKIRMEKAWHYLATEKKSVNEVAFLIGYKNAQHFITAFKKKYQVLPGSLNKHSHTQFLV